MASPSTQAAAAPASGSAPAPAPLHPGSGLVAAVERLLGRSLTKDEAVHWEKIQDTYGVSDDDPLVMVIVLLAVHQHLFNDVPAKINEAVDKAIAVHRTTLEDQATIVAKGLISQLAPMFIQAAGESRPAPVNEGGTRLSAGFVGALCGVAVGCSIVGAFVFHLLTR
ncbi:hypothetical protein [Trinickia mobilis]|uniref:hypothetical protein n=1 Tax=Trinickia mobilis TaxID=2816356 RepID=UPI001A8FDE1F|nr:hypothetical protein [Trinickia mobilis]